MKVKSSGVASADLRQLRHNVRLDRIAYLPIDQVRNYERKLRKRSKEAQQALGISLTAFGFVLPVLIDQHNIIIAGEGLVEAARALGMLEVPTLRVEHLDENETRLLRIALNKLGESSEWDKIELAVEFTEFTSLEIDLAYEVTGFSTPEIDNLIHAPVPAEDDPDDEQIAVGEAGSEVTQLGDLWTLGAHRVACGSSLDASVLAELMAGKLARMVLEDPPYNVKILHNVSGLGKNKHREFAQASGEMSEDEFTRFLSDGFSTLFPHCHVGALMFAFMDWRHMAEMTAAIREANLSLFNLAVWVKHQGAMGSFYRSQHELCFVAKKGTASHRNNVALGKFGRNRTNVWRYPGVNSFGSGRDELLAMHPTCKNVSMLSDAIRDASDRGEIILDGFLGSGSTLIAAERTGRVCHGVELDPLYVDVIIQRWEKATGGTAMLASTGETFAEVASRRVEPPNDGHADIVARTRTRTRVAS